MTTDYANPAIEILRNVAEALGEGWSVPDDIGAVLVGPDEAHICGWVGTYGSEKGRLELIGEFPRAEDGETKWTTWSRLGSKALISVRADRDALAIAKEIRRRLLPTYLEHLPKYLVQRDEEIAQWHAAVALRAELLETLKPLGRARIIRDNLVSLYDRADGKPRVTVDVRDYGYLKVEVEDITPDQVRKIAAFLTTI